MAEDSDAVSRPSSSTSISLRNVPLLTDHDAKEKTINYNLERGESIIYLCEQYNRWKQLKDELHFNTDKEVAELLINEHLSRRKKVTSSDVETQTVEEVYMTQAQPRQPALMVPSVHRHPSRKRRILNDESTFSASEIEIDVVDDNLNTSESDESDVDDDLHVQDSLTYERPKPTDRQLLDAARSLYCAVQSRLKSESFSPVSAEIPLDVWQYVVHGKGTPSNHPGHTMFERQDFSRLTTLPTHWWYHLDIHGQGVAVDFPLKAKAVVSWPRKKFMKKGDTLCEAPRIPIEKIQIDLVRRACNTDNI